MTPALNVQVRLKSRPNGIPQAEHFELAHAPVPELAHGQFLVRNEFLSVEPAMRGWVSAVANYSTSISTIPPGRSAMPCCRCWRPARAS